MLRRRWADVLRHECLAEFTADLTKLADEEDRLSKAKTIEELHYQRGLVDGIRRVIFLVTAREQEERENVRKSS